MERLPLRGLARYLKHWAGNLGSVPDAITSEAAACAKALQEAADYGISRIQLETDSAVLKQALLSSSMDLAACGMLIGYIRGLLHDHFVCSGVLSIPRNCNSVAHNLAKIGLSWNPGEYHVCANPLPEFVQTFVARDVVKPESSMTRT